VFNQYITIQLFLYSLLIILLTFLPILYMKLELHFSIHWICEIWHIFH